jgi:hypothetical protein
MAELGQDIEAADIRRAFCDRQRKSSDRNKAQQRLLRLSHAHVLDPPKSGSDRCPSALDFAAGA